MACKQHPRRGIIWFLIFNLCGMGQLFSQLADDNAGRPIWANNQPVVLPEGIEAYANSDLVIINDKTEFVFMINDATLDYTTSLMITGHVRGARNVFDGKNRGKITRNLLVKINNEKGLAAFKTMHLPQSFDNAWDGHLYKQGRRARISVPNVYDYKPDYFIARKFNRQWSEVSFKNTYDHARWIERGGQFADEDLVNYELQGLKVGDIVEVYYEASFKSDYGNSLFYFNSAWPKLKCEYDFTYKIHKGFGSYRYLLPLFISDSLITKTSSQTKEQYIHTEKITLTNLPGINYPVNSNEGKSLPHVCVDFNFTRVITESFPDPTSRVYEYKYIRPKNFEWMLLGDTNNYYTKIYDKHFGAIRKFVATLPPPGTDSANVVFFKALCDTLNSYRHMTTNHLFYNEPNLYNVSSGDHLLKRRLFGDSTWALYRDILNDNSIFYYRANIEDKRYGEHSIHFRTHTAYEADLVAIPYKSSFIYFMPRYNGMTYHLNELPFYYEGVLGSLKPQNFQKTGKNSGNTFYKFIKTHKGTFNENTRTENGTVKLSLDSLKASLNIKESLSGQFSTVLRHIYLNEFIDSTISPHYFKKCTAKPGATDVKIKLSSKITEYPFRYTFNCTEKMPLANQTTLSLKNWFSFTFSKAVIPEVPTHDYYVDFEFSDSYNFLLDFSSAVDIKNAEAFSKKITTAVFDLESGIVKNSENNYLLKVKVCVKQPKIAVEDMNTFMELVAALDELNNFSLQLERK